MAINFNLPNKPEDLRPTITVIGVGGAGGNAVNNMINSNLEGVNFVVANTDAQALENSLTERRIQLGSTITRGLGAGASPDVGRASAEEAMEEIADYIEGSNMVFITAGMGGGTGTGAAPVVARMAKERGILTVGVVTKPFQFEGNHRMRLAEQGLQELQQFVDTLIVIPNQNLFRIANEKTTFADAFRLADEVLHSGVRGVTDLMIMPGLINLDFADIRTVMGEMGKAMMGTGEAEGAKRAVEAAEAAISNPLLDDVSMKGAKGVLINITGGYDMTLFEADEAATRIREEVDPEANIIFGATFNPALEGKMRVSVVATGIDSVAAIEPKPQTIYGGKIGFMGAKPTNNDSNKFPQSQKTATSEIKTNNGLRASFAQPKPIQTVSESIQVNIKETNINKLAFTRKLKTFIGAVEFRHSKESEQLSLPIANLKTPSFVTPQAAQPAQRSFFSQQEEVEFVKKPIASPRSSANSPKQEQEPQNAMSFLQRMANVGRALSAKPEQESVVEKTKVGVTERMVKKPEENDYLEIPAFLRRQAN